MRRTLAPLERTRIDCPDEILCPRCQTVLDRHQPQIHRQDQLLATCAWCSAWYLVDVADQVLILLPDVASLRPG